MLHNKAYGIIYSLSSLLHNAHSFASLAEHAQRMRNYVHVHPNGGYDSGKCPTANVDLISSVEMYVFQVHLWWTVVFLFPHVAGNWELYARSLPTIILER